MHSECDPKKVANKCSNLVFFWHPLGPTWGAECLAFSIQMGYDDALPYRFGTLGRQGPQKYRFETLSAFLGYQQSVNCLRFLRFDSASSGRKAIVDLTLMHLRRQKITTCSVHTTIVIALDRLAAPRAPRTNLEFQISDQRWSLCTPCICDCCSIRVKITTCMDMHGAALV